MSAQNREQDKVSRIESEDKTLLSGDAESLSDTPPPTDEYENEPTRRFAAPVNEQEQTALQNAPDTEPTKIFSENDTENKRGEREIEAVDELRDAPNENALRPSRLRFALVCLLFVFVVGVTVIHLIPQFSFKSSFPEFNTELKDKRQVIAFVDPNFADRIQIGDELVSINNEPINEGNLLKILARINEGDRYTIQLRRGADLREVELVAQPIPLARVLGRYFFGIFLTGTFLLTGLAVFLLKPNDKQALLMAVLFAVLTLIITPKSNLRWVYGS